MFKRFVLITSVILLSLFIYSCSDDDLVDIPTDIFTMTVDTSQYINTGKITLFIDDETTSDLLITENYSPRSTNPIHLYRLVDGKWQFVEQYADPENTNDRNIDRGEPRVGERIDDSEKFYYVVDLNGGLYNDLHPGCYLILFEGWINDLEFCYTSSAVFELPERE